MCFHKQLFKKLFILKANKLNCDASRHVRTFLAHASTSERLSIKRRALNVISDLDREMECQADIRHTPKLLSTTSFTTFLKCSLGCHEIQLKILCMYFRRISVIFSTHVRLHLPLNYSLLTVYLHC